VIVYLDSSAVLARLFAEDRAPPESLWSEPLVSSRLLAYECAIRLNARDVPLSVREHARALLDRVGFTDQSAEVLARALEPFPQPVRTLDALHLATLDYLRRQGDEVALATYDARLIAAATAMRIPLYR